MDRIGNSEITVNTYREKNRKFLIIEDDIFWQKKISMDLKNEFENVTCFTASSAEAALKILNENRNFDAIVADHWLAGQTSGLDIWKNLSDKHKTMPFILISGDSLSLESNIPFVQKPFNSDVLINAINSQSKKSFANKLIAQLSFRMSTIFEILLVTSAAVFMTLVFLSGLRAVSSTHSIRSSVVERKNLIPSIVDTKMDSSQLKVQSIITPKLRAQLARMVQEADDAQSEVNQRLSR